MAIQKRRRTLQELLSSIGAGAAPVYSGRNMSVSPYMSSQTYPGAGGKPMLFPTYQSAMDHYIANPSPSIEMPNPANWATTADPTKPYGPQGDPFQPNQTVLKDVVPTYQDVNPFIWDQRSGNPSKTYFNEYIQLLTDRHPNFAAEYAANPHAAFEKYEGASGLSGDLMSAYDYHSGAELGPIGVGLTPTMVDQSIKDYGVDAVYGPNVRPNTITTESSLAGMGGLLDPDVAANNGGGLLGTV
jgi:hypothetical protein